MLYKIEKSKAKSQKPKAQSLKLNSQSPKPKAQLSTLNSILNYSSTLVKPFTLHNV